MKRRLSKGKRVKSRNEAEEKWGNVADKAGPKKWLVHWDGDAHPELRASHTLALVDDAAALSPGTRAEATRLNTSMTAHPPAADGGDPEEQLDEDKSDSESGSDEEPADANIHNRRLKEWETKHTSLIGSKTTVKFQSILNHMPL